MLSFSVRCPGLAKTIADVEQLRDDANSGKTDPNEALARARAKVQAALDRLVLERKA